MDDDRTTIRVHVSDGVSGGLWDIDMSLDAQWFLI